ncbi:hypothetical protein BN12_850003 [Nostocoides japonicum T1-X7]|uniref:Uncharacterized protein n=1 Tax=Nostocoides japonicum T1-X7 TaxID=1194083 RepID=A0A077M0T2_9MICO|nr:hypothetical protein BN12_4330004 [Tetrasphaera japonica T1-X7]CCH80298.1 hypothetical protein BN12_850003 [Tetrasphaera japonica T1-X7]
MICDTSSGRGLGLTSGSLGDGTNPVRGPLTPWVRTRPWPVDDDRASRIRPWALCTAGHHLLA